MPLLEVRDLQFTAPGSARPTVRLEQFVLEPGERVAVRGPSGSGKTSVLRCIVGLERSDAAHVRWRGAALADASYPTFRAACTYVPQRPVGAAPTVEEDLAFGRAMAEAHDRPGRLDVARQRRLLERLGLGELPWSRVFDRLSVGEQQRVALVRVLTLAPSVLLLDEPTSALDPERVALVEDLLVGHVAADPDTRALVWVTHDDAQANRIATRTLTLPPRPAASEGPPDG